MRKLEPLARALSGARATTFTNTGFTLTMVCAALSACGAEPDGLPHVDATTANDGPASRRSRSR